MSHENERVSQRSSHIGKAAVGMENNSSGRTDDGVPIIQRRRRWPLVVAGALTPLLILGAGACSSSSSNSADKNTGISTSASASPTGEPSASSEAYPTPLPTATASTSAPKPSELPSDEGYQVNFSGDVAQLQALGWLPKPGTNRLEWWSGVKTVADPTIDFWDKNGPELGIAVAEEPNVDCAKFNERASILGLVDATSNLQLTGGYRKLRGVTPQKPVEVTDPAGDPGAIYVCWDPVSE